MLGRPPSPALKLSRKFWKGETRSTSWRTRIRVGAPRQGIGYLGIFDHDTIELTNLNRQMFFKKDVNKNKGIRLAVNLAAHSACGAVVEGHDLSCQDALGVRALLAVPLVREDTVVGVNTIRRLEVRPFTDK